MRGVHSSLPLRLTVSALLALVCVTWATQVQAQADGPSFAIDVGVSGNNSLNVETVEDCVEVQTGDRFLVDIVVRDITDLLAWEIPLDFQPDVVHVVGQDVKLFQQANEGSSVIDLSNKLPNDSGFHELKAFDSADPQAPDSGTGVLARVTLEAVGPGESPVRFGKRDIDSDGRLDRGSLIRNVDAEIVGDINDDTFFDGEEDDALVVVDGDCPGETVVGEAVLAEESTGDQPQGGEDSSVPWAVIAAGAGGLIVIVAAAVFALTRRQKRRTV